MPDRRQLPSIRAWAGQWRRSHQNVVAQFTTAIEPASDKEYLFLTMRLGKKQVVWSGPFRNGFDREEIHAMLDAGLRGLKDG